MQKIGKFRAGFLVLFSVSLVGCGGGGGGSDASGAGSGGGSTNSVATITGTATGNVSGSSTETSGVLTVADADTGQATFVQPSSLAGSLGTWSVTISGATATWRYSLDASKAPTAASTETLVIKSYDATASQTITVSVAAASTWSTSPLVTTVPTPVYLGAYASEKLAVFNLLNDSRARCGFGKLAQNSKLDTAAQNHADYIALNKAYSHFETAGNPGFTGVTPTARFESLGYGFSYGNENLAQVRWGAWYSGSPDFSMTELSATNNLRGLLATVYHLSGLMERTTEIGLGISNFQFGTDSNGKSLIIDTGVPSGNRTGQLISSDAIETFPCYGMAGVNPVFGEEYPDPFPSVNRALTPYGQPVFVTSGPGTTITLTAGTMIERGGAVVPTTVLTAANDPKTKLLVNQVFLVPQVRLADNAIYDVSLSGTSTGKISSSNPTGAWTKTFAFSTGTILRE